MAFDPNLPFEIEGNAPSFDISKPFEVEEETTSKTSIGDTLQKTAEELEAGVGRAGSAFAKSAVGSVRMITDLFGANNAVSKEIAGVEDYIDQFTTAQAKQDKEEISRLFQEAEGKGLGNKVMAGLKAVAVSPETLGPEMAGYMLPSLAAGLLTGGASIPIQIGTQATIGAAQAAGSIKGDIYQSVRDYSREQGLSEVEADRAATEAQSYGGKNLDLILTNAGIGALAASTGAERIATRILTGRGQDVTKKTLGEFLKQGAMAGGVEALTEGTQEAAEQISQNIALQRQGKDVPTFQNVPQVATMGAVSGGVIGGGLKGVEFLSAEEKEERDINRSAEMESRSLSATDATTKKVINDLNQSENAINSLRDELDTLEPTDPRAQQLRMQISEEQKKATGLKQSIGEEFLSETITEAEKQQIELAKAITAPVAPAEPAPEVAAPTTEAITPLAEVAPPTEPTIKESLPVAPEAPAITPAPVEQPTLPLRASSAEQVIGEGQVAEPVATRTSEGLLETTPIGRTWQTSLGQATIQSEATVGGQPRFLVKYERGATELVRPEELESRIASDVKMYESRQKMAAGAQAQREAEQQEKTKYQDFTQSMTPMQASKAFNALETNVQSGGQLFKRGDLVKQAVDEGAEIVIARDGKRRLQKPDGSYRTESQISKTAMDYADYLIQQKSKQAEQKADDRETDFVITPAPVAETPAVTPAAEVEGDFTPPKNWEETYKAATEGSLPSESFYSPDEILLNASQSTNDDVTLNSVLDKIDPEKSKNKKGEYIVWEIATRPNVSSEVKSRAENLFKQIAPEKNIIQPVSFENIPEEQQISDIKNSGIEAIHYSRNPMELKKGVDFSESFDNVFDNGFYAMEPSDELYWSYIHPLGKYKNKIKVNPKNPILITPETLRKYGYDAINQRVKNKDYDAIIVRGWREDQYQKITDLAEKNWKKNFPEGNVTKEQKNAELDKASIKLLGVNWNDYSKLNDSQWDQNQIFIQPDAATEIVSTTPAVSETITPAAEPAGKPKLGEKGGILIPSREDFIQAGRNIYEAGMEFGTWAKQMIQQFGDVVREFLGDVWQAVSGMPAKLNEVMGYLPKKGEAGAVNIGRGKKQPTKKPAEPTPEQPTPTPEKPTEPVTEVPSGERQQIMGEKIGPLKKTPEGIIAETQAKLRERFDPTKVTEQNTTEAFRALGRLTGKEGTAFAQELNDIGRMVDESGAAAEVSMGAALFVNDLFEYAVRLAAEGQKMMLGIMMTNINKLPTGTEGRTGAGQALRAAREMKDTFLTMARAEQDAFINYAAEFVYGPNPTKQQVDSIKIGYDAVEKVEEPTAEELTDELDEVGKKTGTDLVAKIENEIAQATSTDKDPIVAAMLALQKLGGGTIETKYLPYSKRASSRFEGVKKILKGGLSNYRQKMVEGAATGLETGFWKTLSNEENKPGSLGELDAAQNRELGSIVKSMLISLGLKGTPRNTKMSIYEQVASILGEKPLSQDKIKLADENIRAEIKRKREKELDATEDLDEQDAINVKYDGIENAWDKAMAQQLDMPISESTLRRLIFNELKEENTSIVKLVKMMDENPNDAISKQDGLINSIIEKISKIKFVYPSSADYTLLKENLENQLQGLIQERLLKEAAAKAKAKIAKEAKGSVDLQAEKAENEAQKQIDEFAKIQSDTMSWFVEAKPAKQKVESVLKTIRKAIRDALKLDAGEANDFIQNWKPAFIEKLVKLGVKDSSASILASVVGRQIEVNSMSRKIELQQNEVDSQMQKIQNQAKNEISKLAKIQSDTPSFEVKLPSEAQMNPVREAVKNALKLNLNKMFDPKQSGEIISNFKKSFVKELKGLGVEETAADILADVVGRQIEINSLNNQLKSIDRAIEKGSISEIVKAIKDTPLEQQQNPNWRYEVMRDYLRKAGLNVAQSERIAKLMDISLQKRFTQAKEQAFTDAISKTAPWKAGNVRSKRAFQQVIQAIRAGALDPSRNMASDIAALNGWTGFSADQYKNLLKNDAILADPKSGELQKAEAYKAIQDIISKSKLPIRARDVIGQYYDAQALSGIPTLTVNSFSPIAFAMRNAIVEASSGTIKGDAKAIGRAATAFVDSIKSWANTVAFSFKNNVTVYSNVDYIVNDDNLLRLYRKGVDQFTKSKNAKERADGVKNMMIGMMDYVRRILNALDYGAIASLQNQNISKYAMAVMKNKGMNNKQANEVFAAMMKAKNDFYLQQIAIGTDKNKASILADEFYISSWKKSLEKEGVTEEKIKSAMDAAINDALSSVGRNRQSLDAFKEEATNLKDAGMASSPALWLLESVANAANRSDSQFIKVFSRIIYGFAIVPARVIRETAWFSPYGFVRIMVDAALKNRNIESRYAQSLGSDFQRQQRLNEAIAGTVALFGLMALRASSTDDPEDEDEFKIVFTGNGPQRKDDAQFYDSWYKAGNKPNSMILSFGKTKFTLNMMRGFEAFTWPAMMLGALDDLEIRKKQKQQTKTPAQLEDAAIVAGFVFDAALRRGPYAFTTKSLFGTYGDIGVEGVAKGLTFPAKTLIPVLGTSLASNLSNFLNDPIDRRTLDGAVWSNIPFIGPAVAPKSLNAFGEPSLSTDFASKMFKLGVPIVYDIPTDRESIKLHELVLKQGGGPSIPTRNQLAQRLDRQPTNKEYEMFVREYGTILTTSMKKNYDKLFNAKPEFYSKAVERIGNRARDVAENKVRQAAKKP